MVLWGVRSEGEEGLQVKCVYIEIYIYIRKSNLVPKPTSME